MAIRPIVIAGGGTGGHVYPALAIADALVAAGIEKSSIRFVGSRRGIEASVVPAAGYTVELLPGRGIKRRLSTDNIGAVSGLVAAIVRAKWLVWRWKPRAVVSVGGYAAAPCAIAAVLLRVPLILAESNAVPGAVHRLVGRFAKASAVAYPNTALPHAVVTGNPVRNEIIAIKRDDASQAAAKAELGVDRARVLIATFGGSLGAGSINRAVVELGRRWKDRSDVAIYHVVGQRDWPTIAGSAERPATDGTDELQMEQVEYESRMADLYTAADVVVCRSGATTSAEIAVVGLASVMVPLPGAPGDHQTANANALAAAGAALVLADSDCSAETLAALLDPIVRDSKARNAMAAAARSLGRPDAADAVAKLVLEYAR